MARVEITKKQLAVIDALVQHFQTSEDDLKRFLEVLCGFLTNSRDLMDCVHSLKWRLKDPEHLRDKLLRKAKEARKEGEPFEITRDNLFEKVNDLVGIRILHLHTGQFPEIHKRLLGVLEEGRFPLFEPPFARSWDDETKAFFKECDIAVEDSPSFYTSVHYVVEANQKTRFTCEIQVRTLMEEVWGEVDHSINYPHPTQSVACVEQIKSPGASDLWVLAAR